MAVVGEEVHSEAVVRDPRARPGIEHPGKILETVAEVVDSDVGTCTCQGLFNTLKWFSFQLLECVILITFP